MIVRVRVAWAAMFLLAATGCGDQTAVTSGDGLVGRTFLSESVTEDGTRRELVDGTRISLEFAEDGRLVATAGCNRLLAEVTVRDDTLEVAGVGGTEMGCDPALHEQDQWLTGFLSASPVWELDGGRLTLTSGVTEIVLLDREVADPDRPLKGTRWVVDTIITGDLVSSMTSDSDGSAWLVIEDGTFTASSGCRDVSGSVSVEDGSLRFSDAVQTDPICEPELERVDAVMLAILGGEADVEYSIEADRLQLTHPDDVSLSLHASSSN